jgi:hypothetical protein
MEEHQELTVVIDLVSYTLFTDDFVFLKDELEDVYRRAGEPDPTRLAIKDALYTLICERYK